MLALAPRMRCEDTDDRAALTEAALAIHDARKRAGRSAYRGCTPGQLQRAQPFQVRARSGRAFRVAAELARWLPLDWATTAMPGTFRYYNSWDFNVLGAIYERAVGTSIFESFKQHIADPIGMQDFDRHISLNGRQRVKAYPKAMLVQYFPSYFQLLPTSPPKRS